MTLVQIGESIGDMVAFFVKGWLFGAGVALGSMTMIAYFGWGPS